MKTLRKTAIALAVFILCFMLVPTRAMAGNVTVKTTVNTNKTVAVSGTADTGVLAVAVMIYDNSGKLVAMDTVDVKSGSYFVLIPDTLKNGTYTVKAADYNGGTYATGSFTVGSGSAASRDDVPKTGDIMMEKPVKAILGAMLLSCIGVIILTGRKKRTSHE